MSTTANYILIYCHCWWTTGPTVRHADIPLPKSTTPGRSHSTSE